FRSNTDADQPGWDAAQNRENAEELKDQRRFRPSLACQNSADDPLLDRELQPLRKAHRHHAPLLDCLEVFVRYLAAEERTGEPVSGCNGVLYSDIDSDTAYWRHRVGRITNADQPRPPPCLQSIDGDAEELDVLPKS